MRWGKQHYHHESYLTRKRAASKRRLKIRLIPGYGKHRKYDYRQWQNRNYQRRYRRHTYPSQSERIRAWGEGYSRPRRRRYSRVFNPTTQTRPCRKTSTKDSKRDQVQYQPLSHQTWKNILGWSFTISVFGSLCQYGFYGFFGGFWWMFIFCIIVGWFIGVYKQAPTSEKQSRGSKVSHPTRANANNKPRANSQSSVSQRPSSVSSKSDSSSSSSTMTETVTAGIHVSTDDSEASSDRSNASLELSSLSKAVSSASFAAISNINYDTISTDCKLIGYPDDIDYHDIEPLYSQLSKAKSI